jgi:hypothetical protein
MHVPRKLAIIISYCVFAVVLQFTGGVLSGMGETSLATAFFGAPVSLLPFVLGALIVWPTVGYLLSGRNTTMARRLLVVHYATAPIAMTVDALWWDPQRTSEWLSAVQQHYGIAALWLCPYVLGQIGTWPVLWSSRTTKPAAIGA